MDRRFEEGLDMIRESTPLVSVLLCAYNEERTIGAAIQSILLQTYQKWELILIDDGSTDGTVAIAKRYTDPRIRIVSKKNTGLANSLNFGLALCNGQLVARQDGDDLSAPTRLERQVEEFKLEPALVLCSTWALNMSPKQVIPFEPPTSDRDLRKYMQWDNPIVHTAAMFRRSTVIGLGGYKNIKPCEDYELWIRLARVGRLAVIPEHLVTRRENDNFKNRFYYKNLGLRAIYTKRLECQMLAVRYLGFDIGSIPKVVGTAIKTLLR